MEFVVLKLGKANQMDLLYAVKYHAMKQIHAPDRLQAQNTEKLEAREGSVQKVLQ
jgi:hypothetical protein